MYIYIYIYPYLPFLYLSIPTFSISMSTRPTPTPHLPSLHHLPPLTQSHSVGHYHDYHLPTAHVSTPTVARRCLAFARYCHYQYCMMHGIQRGGWGGVMYCANVAIVLQ